MVGSWSRRTLTGPSTTSSRRRGTPGTRTGSSKSIRSWGGRWWPRRHLRRRPWSRPRIVGLGRAGVAHLVERNLPKVEVAGSRPVARSTYVLRIVLECRFARDDCSVWGLSTSADTPLLQQSSSVDGGIPFPHGIAP